MLLSAPTPHPGARSSFKGERMLGGGRGRDADVGERMLGGGRGRDACW
jgi:hypothetical protein